MTVSVELVVGVAATFLLAGTVKGMIGLGLPTIALAILTATLGLRPAVGLLLLPSFVTSLWQALVGGALVPLSRRLATLLVAACIGTWLGAGVMARTDAALLSGLLGLLITGYAALNLLQVRMPAPGPRERYWSPLLGLVNGLLAGMTGSFVFPGTMYLQTLGLSRDHLIQAMGLLFLVSTVALAVALADRRLLSVEIGALSAAAVIPALAGMAIGQALRHRLSENVFRSVFLWSLLTLGVYIAIRAFTAQ